MAGEDVGLADPNGLLVATAAAQAFDYIGLPEGIFPIVEATLYLSTAPKSNSGLAYFKAFQRIEQDGIAAVPAHLQDSNRDARSLGHGVGYQYPHEDPSHFLPQQYLPKSLLGTYFYRPSGLGYEVDVNLRLTEWRSAQREALGISKDELVPDLSDDQIKGIKGKHGR